MIILWFLLAKNTQVLWKLLEFFSCIFNWRKSKFYLDASEIKIFFYLSL